MARAASAAARIPTEKGEEPGASAAGTVLPDSTPRLTPPPSIPPVPGGQSPRVRIKGAASRFLLPSPSHYPAPSPSSGTGLDVGGRPPRLRSPCPGVRLPAASAPGLRPSPSLLCPGRLWPEGLVSPAAGPQGRGPPCGGPAASPQSRPGGGRAGAARTGQQRQPRTARPAGHFYYRDHY